MRLGLKGFQMPALPSSESSKMVLLDSAPQKEKRPQESGSGGEAVLGRDPGQVGFPRSRVRRDQ